MGKKDGNRKRKAEEYESENEQEDAELQAELAALQAARNEKLAAHGDAQPDKVVAYNKDGLLKCVEELDRHLPFAETLMVTGFSATIVNENDDIEREMAFYNQTLTAVAAGRAKMQEAGLPVRRPNDYFCENVKSDAHMTKIKDRLLIEEKRIEAFELRKNKDNNRKFNKQVQELRKAENAANRKKHITDVSKIRKEGAGAGEGDKDAKVKQLIDGPAQKSKKRINMDKKYGFGGQERKRAKLNDKKSLNDLSDFNPRGGKAIRRDGGGKGRGGAGGRPGGKPGGKPGAGKNRPGKAARDTRRASRSGSA